MQSTIKKILLPLTLVLPVLTYLFLKSFGENYYELPVYYEIDGAGSDCSNLSFPHTLNWPELAFNQHEATIIYYPESITGPDVYRQLERVTDKFEQIQVLAVMHSTEETRLGKVLIVSDEQDFNSFMNCQLLLGEGAILDIPASDKIVLVDKIGRIRGYYLGSEFDDMERLELELKILFTEDEQAKN